MRNSTFLYYVRNPHRFFRTILPRISEELERSLLRVFCLDPARRISLPELKIHIRKFVSFVHRLKEQSTKKHIPALMVAQQPQPKNQENISCGKLSS